MFAFFAYFRLYAPFAGIFWANLIALPSSSTMLVYFTIQAPSTGLSAKPMISSLPPLSLKAQPKS